MGILSRRQSFRIPFIEVRLLRRKRENFRNSAIGVNDRKANIILAVPCEATLFDLLGETGNEP
jgi:hypothetical protein